MKVKGDVQPDTEEKDHQPDDQDPKDNQESDQSESSDDFEPKLSAKDYAKKWREASAEAAKFRKELSAIKADREKHDKAKLKEQGKYKEMYESLSQEHGQLKDLIATTSRSVAFRQEYLKSGGKPHLAEAAEKLVALSEIELDDKFKVNREQVSFELDKFREKYGTDFFQNEKRPPKDGAPKKPDTEQGGMVSEAKKAKTQAEFDAVLKKYGMA
jgi:hypothetical protein